MSLVFYAFGEPKYIILLVITAFINYLGGLVISAYAERPEAEENAPKHCAKENAALFLTVLISLGFLGYYKYAGFFSEIINSAAGTEILAIKDIVLPIGISFYTFQALSYTIDLYRGKCEVQRSFFKLLLYISFFPQLIAGPIVRYSDIAGQINGRKETADKFAEGAERFIEGLAKKVILANTFASGADAAFALDMSQRTAAIAWFGIFLYTLQIYFDFSGYSDMAIGLGKMFGFDFLENFNLPYIAGSIAGFWRRWHISLSTWFREYLYIPLGGNRKGLARTCVNLGIVFLATGLWHGAGMNFVLWGAIHGFFIIIERLWLGKKLESGGAVLKAAGHVYTLLIVMLAWVFFRADNITQGFGYIGSMLNLSQGAAFAELFSRKCIILSIIGAAFAAGLGVKLKKMTEPVRPAVLLLLLFICMLLLASDSYNPFIYFRF